MTEPILLGCPETVEPDIDFGWLSMGQVPSGITSAAHADFLRDGPEEFKDTPLTSFGWQQVLAAPGWWLIRVIPRSRFWGYGLYYLWTPGQLRHVEGNGEELAGLVAEGCVSIADAEAAAQWIRLWGVLRLEAGVPLYVMQAAGVCKVHRLADGGWLVQFPRRWKSKLDNISVWLEDRGKPAQARVMPGEESVAADTDEPMLMTGPDVAGLSMAVLNKEFSGASPEEKAEIDRMNWTLVWWCARVYAVLLVIPIIAFLVSWRLVRAVRVLPLLPGLLISRYVPSALDIGSQKLLALLSSLESTRARRVASVVVWFAVLTVLVEYAGRFVSLGAAIMLAAGYAHATWVFIRNEAIRLRVFRHSERAAEYLSHLNDFVTEYALCGLLFLLALPLLVGRVGLELSAPGLPATVGEAYWFTFISLVAQVPDSIRQMIPLLPDPGDPPSIYAKHLRSAIQYLFQLTALGLVVDKVWAARGLRAEVDERLHRSLKEAVALGERACGHLLKTIKKEVDAEKLRMALLALGMVGDAPHAAKLKPVVAKDHCTSLKAETSVALALMGDRAALPAGAQVVLTPSQHGGDAALDLASLVRALRSDQPSSDAANDLRRLLAWQGVSTRLRRSAMLALLRIPGAFSAQDALEWTKEFVGSTHVLESESELLDLFGRASLSPPMPELATAIASQWISSPLVSLIPLVKYTRAALEHDANANGRSGLAVALTIAFMRSMEAEKDKRYHRWKHVDKVLRTLTHWRFAVWFFALSSTLASFHTWRDAFLAKRSRPP